MSAVEIFVTWPEMGCYNTGDGCYNTTLKELLPHPEVATTTPLIRASYQADISSILISRGKGIFFCVYTQLW